MSDRRTSRLVAAARAGAVAACAPAPAVAPGPAIGPIRVAPTPGAEAP